jgi:alpha-L-fucosidase 2
MSKTNSFIPVNKLLCTKPASRWQEAFPMGNGRIGAMIYGIPGRDVVDLSESTCFSGEASSGNNVKGAPEAFLAAREAVLKNDYKAARQHINNYIPNRLNYGTNLPLGHLNITAPEDCSAADGYGRSLQLDTAVAKINYTIEGCNIAKSAFVSNPHQVILYKVTSSLPGKLNLTLSLDGGDNPFRIGTDANNDILLYGNAFEAIHSDGKTGVAFHARLRAVTSGGSTSSEDHKLQIRNAEDVLILVAVATTFGGKDPEKDCKTRIDTAAALSYEELLRAHCEDFTKLFSRVELSLGNGTDNSMQAECSYSTESLLASAKAGQNDPAFTALMFQYGRYLLISSSRENSPLPTHLQGVWNDSVACRIGWTCDMHLDINTQMNYWPAEVTNLPECHMPLFNWIENSLVPSGRITTREAYGLKGWVAELVSNAWGFAAPYWHGNLSPCPTGGVWIAAHMWEHYLYSGDAGFLKQHAFPVLEEAVEFFIDYIFEDPKTGYLTSGPSISPENSFVADGDVYTVSIGPTYEIVMIRELFNMYTAACKALGCEGGLLQRVLAAVDRLYPFETGMKGELKEWSHNYRSADPQHRHTSHLLSLFPFSQIDPEKTPGLAKAAKKCLELKMIPPESWEDTGWARSMLLLYSARLLEKEEAYRHIQSMLCYLTNPNLTVKHPPTRGAPSFADVYELDGNTGLTACIAEMLIQSHNGEIRLLPVLPDQWSTGHVKGLCARGGFEVEMDWKDGKLKEAVITARNNSTCHVRYGDCRTSFVAAANGVFRLDGNLQPLSC